MLADFRIVLLDLHLSGHGLFVLGRRIEVAGTSRRLELDFFTHGCSSLSDFAAGAQISEHHIDTVLVDGAQTGG